MKVPKNPTPPPEKDKTVTRRQVKGAAGGMKGVDYEDDRRADHADEGASIAAGSRARALLRESKVLERALPQRPAEDLEKHATVTRDPAQLILDDEEGAAEDAKKKQRRRHVARDRFSVDKDAPELIRRRRWENEEDEAPDQEGEREPPRDADLDFDMLGDLIGGQNTAAGRTRARIFAKEDRPEPGDPRLTDPDEIQRALETPLAYAKHAMILAEAFRRSTGATRGEAIEYLAKMFVAPSDRSFGRIALKEFGPASGIVDIYPLEVIELVLNKYPGFLPKVGFGRLFRNLPEGEKTIFTDTATPVILEYPEELKIRGFALVGGGRPGYTFEPHLEPGKYQLHIQTSGRYTLLISATNRNGYSLIERLAIKVRARTVKDLGLPEEASYYPERSEEKVRAWPTPVPKPIDPSELFQEEATPSSALSTGELLSMKERDAMLGRERCLVDQDDGDAPLLSPGAVLAEEDAEVLKLAVQMVIDEAEVLATDACAPEAIEEKTARIELPDDFGEDEPASEERAEITVTEFPLPPEDMPPPEPEPEDTLDPADRTQPIDLQDEEDEDERGED